MGATPAAPELLRVVKLDMTLKVEEGSLVAGGVTPIDITGWALATLPRAGGPPVIVPAHWNIQAHPTDQCTWNLVDSANGKVKAMAGHGGGLGVGIDFIGPEWHFSVDCPGRTIRFPANGERSVTGWLGLTMTTGGPGGAVLPTTLTAGNERCLKHQGGVRDGTPFGSVVIRVEVLTDLVPGGCLPPP